MRVSQGIRRGAALIGAAGIAVATMAITATSAEAANYYTGKVTANGGVTVRTAPSVHSSGKGTIAEGKTISIDCKVPGTRIDGNSLWYSLGGKKGWVSARYVANVGLAPDDCPSSDTEFGSGRTTATLNQRSGPHFNDTLRGTLKSGTKLNISCYATSTASVDGNSRWFLLESDRWVSAAYVKPLPGIPTNWVPCTV